MNRGRRHHDRDAPPAALVSAWQNRRPDLFTSTDSWERLAGGRTNAVWRVSGGLAARVVKLYRAGAETLLFANDPDAEATSLGALSGSGLAPHPISTLPTQVGQSIAYGHVPGRSWRTGDPLAAVAEALARLHAFPVPGSLPIAPIGPERLADETRALRGSSGQIAAVPATSRHHGSSHRRPPERYFIHGDPTASNTLVTARGITFIDWQCPAQGDPADDLALFLSPAMQVVSGNAPLSVGDEAAFLAAYAQASPTGAETVARYRALAPLYHARMTAYADWRTARGDSAYAGAAEAERARVTPAE